MPDPSNCTARFLLTVLFLNFCNFWILIYVFFFFFFYLIVFVNFVQCLCLFSFCYIFLIIILSFFPLLFRFPYSCLLLFQYLFTLNLCLLLLLWLIILPLKGKFRENNMTAVRYTLLVRFSKLFQNLNVQKPMAFDANSCLYVTALFLIIKSFNCGSHCAQIIYMLIYSYWHLFKKKLVEN